MLNQLSIERRVGRGQKVLHILNILKALFKFMSWTTHMQNSGIEFESILMCLLAYTYIAWLMGEWIYHTTEVFVLQESYFCANTGMCVP